MNFASRLFVLLFCARAVFAQPTNTLLTNAMDVLSLPGDRAFGMGVSIRGVVTAAQPVTPTTPYWEGRFFVQDATAGVFVDDSKHRQPAAGDYVEVTGIASPGGYAPYISEAHWRKLGTAPLPVAKPVLIEQLMAGIEDSQRVEVSGIIRAVKGKGPVVVFEIVSGGYRLSVYAPPPRNVDPQSLVGARVRVRGTASTYFSGQLRQLITVELHVPFPSDFMVEKPPPGNPFGAPILALNRLAQYREGRELGEQLHVKGVVTFLRPGQGLFLQDAAAGIQVQTRQLENLTPGDVVEAVGFLDSENFLPILEDATIRKTTEPRQTVKPAQVAIGQLQAGYRQAELITLQGKVLDRTLAQASQKDDGLIGSRAILTLQSEGVLFRVEGYSAEPDIALARVPLGSTVAVNGICFMQISADGRLRSLELFLPTAKDIRILEKPNWLTPERLRVGLAILFAILVATLTWILMVHKKNLALELLIKEKTEAQQELQESHDLLEWRVAERTKQLKIEMTARKEAEVRAKAILAERTRLARELHDTLQQSLTGIGFHLDTAGILMEKDPAAGNRHLRLVRELMTRSQLELRRSVWDLRSRELEQFDFPTALRVTAQQIAEGTNLRVETETTGGIRALSEVTEENLLRICQEVLTNVIKHAGASEVKVRLEYGQSDVVLRITDNGGGFTPEHSPGRSEGHFGLIGMMERAKRLDGHLRVTSTPGSGTCVEVRVPMMRANEMTATAMTETQQQT